MKNDNPELVIETGSHTDICETKENNEALAIRRVNSTYEY